MVERNLAKVEVTSSNLVCRSTFFKVNCIALIVLNSDIATLAQLVERNLAKVEVTSSNLVCRSKFILLHYAIIHGRGMEQLGSSSGS